MGYGVRRPWAGVSGGVHAAQGFSGIVLRGSRRGGGLDRPRARRGGGEPAGLPGGPRGRSRNQRRPVLAGSGDRGTGSCGESGHGFEDAGRRRGPDVRGEGDRRTVRGWRSVGCRAQQTVEVAGDFGGEAVGTARPRSRGRTTPGRYKTQVVAAHDGGAPRASDGGSGKTRGRSPDGVPRPTLRGVADTVLSRV
jgi:hypothetical protein